MPVGPSFRALARWAFGSALALFTVSPALPQPSATVSIAGEVADGTGALVPAAAVTLRREAVGLELRTTTDGAGRFAFGGVPPGDYVVTAAAPGFSVATARVEARPGGSAAVRLSLVPGVFSEEVTVVGSRLAGGPETLRRIPGSVEVLGPEALETAHVFTASEALRKATGVHARDEEGFGLRPNIGLRGLNPTRSSKTLLLEDGLFLTFAPYGDNASYYHPPIERFESVEVLKGSGQIAYGPSTVGGVVNYLTPDPPARPQAALRLTAGNRDYRAAQLHAGGTWGPAGLLVDYLRKRGDGARQNTHSVLDDASAKAVLALGPRHTLTAKANRYAEDSTVTYSGLREAEYRADPRQNPFAHDAFTGRRYGASVKHTFLAGERVLLATQAYASSFDRDWWRQSSNSNQRPNDAADPRCGDMANLDSTCGNEGRLRRYDLAGIEPRLRFGHRLFGAASEAEVGARAHFETQKRRQENGDTPTARRGVLVENNERRNQAWSAFVQNRLMAGPWTITPGLRVEHIRYERTNRLANAGAGVTGRTSLTQWVPGVGVSFAPSERLTIFGGVHRGFAPPRTEDVISNTTGEVVDLEPERSWNYELGLRSLPRPGLRLEATAFRMDYENQIVPASVAGGVGATLTNGGATLNQGFEASLRLDAGTLTGSPHDVYARLALTAVPTARFTGRRLSSVPGHTTVSVSGNRLPYAPELMLTASLGYTHASGFDAFLEAVRVGEQFGDDLNTLTPTPDGQRGLVPEHTVWNATVNVPLRALRSTLFLTVKNVFDRSYIVDRSRGVLPGSPRLVQAGVKARF
jgi:Fe(3+) dicitrate transport protein